MVKESAKTITDLEDDVTAEEAAIPVEYGVDRKTKRNMRIRRELERRREDRNLQSQLDDWSYFNV